MEATRQPKLQRITMAMRTYRTLDAIKLGADRRKCKRYWNQALKRERSIGRGHTIERGDCIASYFAFDRQPEGNFYWADRAKYAGF